MPNCSITTILECSYFLSRAACMIRFEFQERMAFLFIFHYLARNASVFWWVVEVLSSLRESRLVMSKLCKELYMQIKCIFIVPWNFRSIQLRVWWLSKTHRNVKHIQTRFLFAGTVTTWATTFAPTVTAVIFVSFLPVWQSDGISSHGRPEAQAWHQQYNPNVAYS